MVRGSRVWSASVFQTAVHDNVAEEQHNAEKVNDLERKIHVGSRRRGRSLIQNGPFSRFEKLCMGTSNEADTEDKHAEREQRCTDIGQINKTIRGFGIGRQNRQEERRRN
jgi:hypothetical protein